MSIYCMSYLRKSKKVEFSTWFYTFYFTFQLMKKQLISKFFYGNLENSNTTYPSMVAHHQVTLEYSILIK